MPTPNAGNHDSTVLASPFDAHSKRPATCTRYEFFDKPSWGFPTSLSIIQTSELLRRLSLTIPVLQKAAVATECIPTLTDLVLAPGGAVLCSSTLSLTQDDLDVGRVRSEIFSRGEASDGEVARTESRVEQKLDQEPRASVGEEPGD